MSSGFGLFGSKPDTQVTTSSVAAPKTTEAISDENTVRNAVSSIDVNRTSGNPIPWANAETGSAGVITSLVEDLDRGTRCRAFRTTRHSYEGIANFEGKACLADDGNWQLLRFRESN